MEQIIYADILFLIDVSMDFFALYLTSFFIKTRFSSGRSILAAALGGIFSVLTVVLRSSSIVLTVLVSVIMCLIAFIGNKAFVVLKSIICFYLVNLLLGGAMTAIFNVFNAISGTSKEVIIYGEVKTVGDNMPFTLFLIGCAVVLVIIRVVIKMNSRTPSLSPRKCTVTLCGRTAELTLMEDSGNTLCEPISGDAVVFLTEKAVMRLANEEYISALKLGKGYYEGKNKHKFRVVVYKTVSGSDICACVRPERMLIDGKDARAWIAIGKNLTNITTDGIVPSSLLV